MNNPLSSKFLTPLTALCLLAAGLSSAVYQKHPLDKSEVRRFILPNKLRVLCVSDPAFNKSAAAMVVEVGSLKDPKDRQGLAHFTEHMLFLGTRKYPEAAEYGSYLTQRGGYANGYTADDHTSFHFEVHHAAFEGALDRFSQFFIAPLFDQKYIDREMRAVDSEHQKNRMDDGWRRHLLIRRFLKKDHPANHFGTGNLDTLKNTTRAEVMAFYRAHYSANRMVLVMLGDKNLDTLEAMARRYFSAVANNNFKKPRYPADTLAPMAKLRLIEMRPVKDTRELLMSFAVPSPAPYFRSRPLGLLSFCVGHEGPGSLLSFLKKEGLATGLSSGGYANTNDFGTFNIRVDLTPKGLDQYLRVMRYCFSYAAMLKKKGFQKTIFQEEQTMARLNYIYSDKGEGGGRASDLALKVIRYGLDAAEKTPLLMDRPDPAAYQRFLACLRPDTMIAVVTAPSVKTNRIEPIYGTPYRYTEVSGQPYAMLKNPPLEPALNLPRPNPFVPEKAALLSERPICLQKDAGGELWFAQDTTFRRPKVRMIFRLRLPKEKSDAAHLARLALYTECVREQLNETAYPAAMAGLRYSISGGLDGIRIQVGGYSGAAQKLLTRVAKELGRLTVSPERFEALREHMVRQHRSFNRQPAWQVSREISRAFHNQTHFFPAQKQVFLEKLTLTDIKDFAGTVTTGAVVEALVHGNCTADDARRSFSVIRGVIRRHPLSPQAVFEQAHWSPAAATHIRYAHQLITNNSCFRRNYVLSADTPKNRALMRLLDNLLQQPFYSQMRTKQQLGYIVWSAGYRVKDQLIFTFIIQSASHDPREIETRVDRFLKSADVIAAELPEKKFQQLKLAVRKKLEEQSKSIAEKAGIFNTLIFDRSGDFERKAAELDALQKIRKEDLAAFLKNITDAKKVRCLSILSYGKDKHAPPKSAPLLLRKQSLPYK